MLRKSADSSMARDCAETRCAQLLTPMNSYFPDVNAMKAASLLAPDTRSVKNALTRAFFTDFPYVASAFSVSLQGRLHRCAMETCSACIDSHTVFALAPRANRLKNALAADAFCCSSARGCWRVQPTLRAPFPLNRRFFRSFI